MKKKEVPDQSLIPQRRVGGGGGGGGSSGKERRRAGVKRHGPYNSVFDWLLSFLMLCGEHLAFWSMYILCKRY